jgi:hypothetical protein
MTQRPVKKKEDKIDDDEVDELEGDEVGRQDLR